MKGFLQHGDGLRCDSLRWKNSLRIVNVPTFELKKQTLNTGILTSNPNPNPNPNLWNILHGSQSHRSQSAANRIGANRRVVL